MPDRAFHPYSHVLSVADGNDTILLDLKQGRYYSLNEPAGRFWGLLAEGVAPSDACQRVCEEFDEDEDIIRRDLGALLIALNESDLLENGERSSR
jgi:hypothetical protein